MVHLPGEYAMRPIRYRPAPGGIRQHLSRSRFAHNAKSRRINSTFPSVLDAHGRIRLP